MVNYDLLEIKNDISMLNDNRSEILSFVKFKMKKANCCQKTVLKHSNHWNNLNSNLGKKQQLYSVLRLIKIYKSENENKYRRNIEDLKSFCKKLIKTAYEIKPSRIKESDVENLVDCIVLD